MKTKLSSLVVGIVAAGLVVLAVAAFKPVTNHLARASGEACQSTQKVVTAGASLTSPAAAKTWAVDARARLDDLEDGGKLQYGLARYIGLVEASFTGKVPDPKVKSDVAASMDVACPGMKVAYPR
jgi:hypothetical protein